VRALRDLLGRDVPMDDSVQTPQHTIASAVSCRVVISGSYHAAVFALSVGVPVLGLAASQYYVEKFEGLSALFGGGCETVRMDRDGWPGNLQHRISTAWANSETLRAKLLTAAERQIGLGRAAYQKLHDIVGSP